MLERHVGRRIAGDDGLRLFRRDRRSQQRWLEVFQVPAVALANGLALLESTRRVAARATTPGEFVVPPAKAEEMYHPETFGRGAGDILIVLGRTTQLRTLATLAAAGTPQRAQV